MCVSEVAEMFVSFGQSGLSITFGTEEAWVSKIPDAGEILFDFLLANVTAIIGREVDCYGYIWKVML